MKSPYENSKQTGAHFSKPVLSGSPAVALAKAGIFLFVDGF